MYTVVRWNRTIIIKSWVLYSTIELTVLSRWISRKSFFRLSDECSNRWTNRERSQHELHMHSLLQANVLLLNYEIEAVIGVAPIMFALQAKVLLLNYTAMDAFRIELKLNLLERFVLPLNYASLPQDVSKHHHSSFNRALYLWAIVARLLLGLNQRLRG